MTEAIEKVPSVWPGLKNAGIQRKAGRASEIDIEMYLASAALVLIIYYSFETHLSTSCIPSLLLQLRPEPSTFRCLYMFLSISCVELN